MIKRICRHMFLFGDLEMTENKLDDRMYRYTPNVGTVNGPIHCGVCGDVMNEEKDIVGARSFYGAMAGIKEHYDLFECPNHKENWHRQVVALRRRAAETCSARLEQVFREEANEILETRKATKVVY